MYIFAYVYQTDKLINTRFGQRDSKCSVASHRMPHDTSTKWKSGRKSGLVKIACHNENRVGSKQVK